MSASSKKKLRKEESVVVMTEKQRDEQKENKKMKAYTVAFVTILAVIVIAALAIAGSTFVKRSGMPQKKTVAAVVDGQELNTVELSYYYTDTITAAYNNWLRSYGDNVNLYLQLMGLDISKPLDQQAYAGGDTTWADYFVDQAIEAAKSDAALCKQAESEGYSIGEEEQKMLEAQKSQMEQIIKANGFGSMKEYLRTNYGPGADETSYNAHAQRSALAASYLRSHSDNISFEQSEIDNYNKEHFEEFSSYSYASYYIPAASYLEGGVKDEEGNTTYTDEEKAAAVERAKADADSLIKVDSVEALDAAIKGLSINKENENAKSETVSNQLYTNVNEKIRGWISDSSRKSGDMTAVLSESETTDAEGNTTKNQDGYMVLMYLGSTDNMIPMSNVRHILVAYEGGTKGENGVVTYSEEEKAAAKQKAEDILNEWKSGDATEDSFSALAASKSADSGSAANGGLIEKIIPSSNLVPEFRDWAVDSQRSTGDTGIVESTYGYHVMYFVGNDSQNYREYMVEATMHQQELDKWYESLLEAIATEKKDDSYLNKSFVIKAN